MKRIDVLIVDDDEQIRDLLANHLKLENQIGTVLQAEGGAEALMEIQSRHIDVVLSDISMPGMDGPELLTQAYMLEHCPPFVMMTAFDSDCALLESLSLGAVSYVPKLSTHAELVAAVLSAAGQERYLTTDVATRMVNATVGSPDTVEFHHRVRSLSAIERTILKAVCSGASNADIAKEFHYAESTVKNRVSSLLRTFGFESRAELITALRYLHLN